MLNFGLRYADVSNTVTDGRKYVDVKGQIAPRVQAIFDLNDDGVTKLFATYGRYYQPVSANMNIIQGAARPDVHDYYLLDQIDANGEVVLLAEGSLSAGEYIGNRVVQESLNNPELAASVNLESMYSDEVTLGFEQRLMDGDMVLGMRVVYRNLGRAIEDTDYSLVINKYLADNNLSGDTSYTYVLAKPGSTIDIKGDFNGDGNKIRVVIPGVTIGLPEPERQYGALETNLSGVVADFHYNASYTWSHS